MDEHKKKKDDIIAKLKKVKNIKLITSIIGGTLPFALILFVVLSSAIAKQYPNFVGVTMVGGQTVYGNSASDLPTDLTTTGVDTWNDDEKKIFEDYQRQLEYYNNGFTYYNVKDIKDDSDEKFDVSTPFATINYQGIVNLTAFDNKYSDNGPLFSEYQGEGNVLNRHTRDFYKQAGEYTGNNFIVYPGKRMLLGHLVANSASYSVVQYKEWPCGTEICSNASEIYSEWSYIGKITAENDEDARKNYGVSGAVNNLESAISAGKSQCNSSDLWVKANGCHDKEVLYSELLGSDYSDSDSVTSYLSEKYSTEEIKASVPTGELVNGHHYITVSVSKKIDYELYEKYLKEVYIPHIYIDCEDCSYRDSSDDVKKTRAKNIYDDIMLYTNTFKMYNKEDTIGDYTYGGNYFGGGGNATIPGVSYQCGEYKNGISSDYSGHRANDLYSTSPSLPNIYPLLEGEVVKVVNSCSSICPRSDANRYINGAKLSTLSSACRCGSGWGNHIQIKSTYNGKTIYAIYAHLSSVNVSVGDNVTYNTVLGVMGTTGVSTGNHLHIELSYTGSSSDKFPPTKIFSRDTVLGTLCERNVDGDEDE